MHSKQIVASEISVGRHILWFDDGTKEVTTWPVMRHAGYKGWPTHKPPYGWRKRMAEEVNDLMDHAREVQRQMGLRDFELYPDEVIY